MMNDKTSCETRENWSLRQQCGEQQRTSRITPGVSFAFSFATFLWLCQQGVRREEADRRCTSKASPTLIINIGVACFEVFKVIRLFLHFFFGQSRFFWTPAAGEMLPQDVIDPQAKTLPWKLGFSYIHFLFSLLTEQRHSEKKLVIGRIFKP